MTRSIAENKKKVAVGLSGGVDSAVSAYVLKQQGYDVTGIYMECWETKADGCGANEDKAYALQNASKLGIPFKSLDFKETYKKNVIDYFYKEYQAGRTPNPDVMCNKEVKFGIFFNWAMKEGYDFVATGHYAQLKEENGVYNLLRGKDVGKDQSYFLYLLGQEQLSHTLFPIGDLEKKELRDIAIQQELPSAKRAESMGICFVGEVDIKEFLEERIEHKKGNVLDLDGNIIGEHDGVWFFTIGQRHGFSVNTYFGHPLYVVKKLVDTNELVVGKKEDCLVSEFLIKDIHLISPTYLPLKEDLLIRIRHLGKLHKAKVTKNEDLTYKVALEDSVFGVASGQSCVLYDGEITLGGGIICERSE